MKQPVFINLRDISFPPIRYSIEKEIPKDFSSLSYGRYVQFSDEVMELNFRVIETYLPEILFLLSTNIESLAEGIKQLSQEKPYRTVEFSERALTYKLCYFVEALLYSDLFNGVWDGKILNDKIYVEKQKGTLQYYSIFEMRKLTLQMLDKLKIQRTESILQITHLST